MGVRRGSAAALLLFQAMLPLARAADPPIKIEYTCPAEDIDSFGMACSNEDPCAVFLELSAVEAVGTRLIASGNLHTQSSTLYTILLSSEDGGRTWTEPFKRQRAAVLEQIQFADFANGWISGQSIEPLPKDPFLLITTDGGKTWKQRALFEESRFGSVSQFWFDSATTGELVFDRSERGSLRHEVYETHTGGESWEVKESTTKAVKLKGGRGETSWRLRVDAPSKTYRIERRGSSGWELSATIAIHVADCK